MHYTFLNLNISSKSILQRYLLKDETAFEQMKNDLFLKKK